MFVVDTYAVSGVCCEAVPSTAGFCRNDCGVCAQREQIPIARKELHRLLENRCLALWVLYLRSLGLLACDFVRIHLVRELATTPIMIVANKIDLEPHISEQDLIRGGAVS
jgi:hypothetical protein